MRQAFLLSKLEARFRDAGYARINFVILTNSTANANSLRTHIKNLNVVVIDENVQSPLNDFHFRAAYVFDSCGRLVYIIYDPWSAVHKPFVKAAVLSTYFDAPCGQCPEDVSRS